MHEEDAFLRALRDRPDDHATRQVYIDWLLERDQPGDADRAAFLRADADLAGLAAEDVRRGGLRDELRELSANLDIAWRALVARTPIENCAQDFDFECPLTWDQLKPTDAPSVRHCETCDNHVYYCGNIREATAHSSIGNCVAVDVLVKRAAGDLPAPMRRMGRFLPPGYPAWDRSPAARRSRRERDVEE
jgi:uncharacterized protein (TIGR02996 family)